VTLSSSEAEYITAYEAAKDASWTRQLLQESQMTEIPTILTGNDIEEWFRDFVDECSSRGEC
jgi:hypothetical protein